MNKKKKAPAKKKAPLKKKVSLKKKPEVVEGFLTIEQLAMGMPTKVSIKKVRKPKTKVIAKTKSITKTKVIAKVPVVLPEKKLYIKYFQEIISLITDEGGYLKEIIFTYKGVLVIPLSLKNVYKPDSHTVQSTFIIPNNIKDPILTKRYDRLTNKAVRNFLTEHLRDDYITGIKEVIYKEVWPEHKIINKLPWK